jgi:hypothetical protein
MAREGNVSSEASRQTATALDRDGGPKAAGPEESIHAHDVTEQKRLNDARETGIPWKKWGPYLSERQWGTVREDYSEDGNAWDYFSHDQSRSRAYRWGEDGLGGISDDKQRLCFALAFWNESDPILKERLFGLTNSEGNDGEDVKEYYFYLDSTPTHSYMKYLYKYPQREFPYRDLVETNGRRSRQEFEYELLDTGIFDDDRYFDVFLEYAKEGPDDILIRVTVHNRGPEAARLHLLPTLWFRNTWSWGKKEPKPVLRETKGAIRASHPELGDYTLSCDGTPELLFTENESNAQKRLERILGYLLDEKEFLGPHGIRSLSRHHQDHPFVFHVGGHAHNVSYLPAESDTGMFGGNSNWRGPVWMPVNGLIIRGLIQLYRFYGDDFTVECPTGSGIRMTLFEVAQEITRRLASIFLRDGSGRRPVYGGTAKFQSDPHWRDLILFHEYFHGDNGAGLGASHQTGWTGTSPSSSTTSGASVGKRRSRRHRSGSGPASSRSRCEESRR